MRHQNAQRGDPAATADPDKVGSKLAQRLKALFVGISVAVIIVVALRFAPGQISEPVKSQFGWHIIKVEGKRMKTFRPSIR